MDLMRFWIKVIAKRMFNLFKSSPLLVIWIMIIIGAFIYAFSNRYIELNLDTRSIFIVISLLIIYSFLRSIKNYNVMPVLIIYSKSKLQNRYIYFRFFLKQAFLNNILLLIWGIVTFNSLIYKKYSIMAIGLIIFSIILSYLIMYIKNQRLNKIIKNGKKGININPKIKSIIHDYFSSDFLIMVILSFALFIVFMLELIKHNDYLQNIENQSNFFIILTIIFSIGFMGIIDAITKINWKFQALISPNDLNYHIRRTMLILGVMFVWLLVPFVIIGSIVNVILLIKYLYCIFVLFMFTVLIAFTFGHILIKGTILTLFIGLTIWISTLPAGFLLILLIPVVLMYFKAKNEYREWFQS
jgi:hypothetical protein